MPARIVQVKPTGQWTAKRTARRFSLVMLAPRFLRGRYGDEALHAPVAADFTTRLAPALPLLPRHTNAWRQEDFVDHCRLAEILPSPSSPILDPRIAYRTAPHQPKLPWGPAPCVRPNAASWLDRQQSRGRCRPRLRQGLGPPPFSSELRCFQLAAETHRRSQLGL